MDDTIGQLSGLVYELNSQGRMKVEPKENTRARKVPSPEHAEALMLALCKPFHKFEYFTTRNPPGGSSVIPLDDDFDRNDCFGVPEEDVGMSLWEHLKAFLEKWLLVNSRLSCRSTFSRLVN